jgi:hypothetical protein
MFSVIEKRQIATAVQQMLRDTGHHELPTGEIQFRLVVKGTRPWSWADIRNNGAVAVPGVNPHNEAQAERCAHPEPMVPLRLVEEIEEALDDTMHTLPIWEGRVRAAIRAAGEGAR